MSRQVNSCSNFVQRNAHYNGSKLPQKVVVKGKIPIWKITKNWNFTFRKIKTGLKKTKRPRHKRRNTTLFPIFKIGIVAYIQNVSNLWDCGVTFPESSPSEQFRNYFWNNTQRTVWLVPLIYLYLLLYRGPLYMGFLFAITTPSLQNEFHNSDEIQKTKWNSTNSTSNM